MPQPLRTLPADKRRQVENLLATGEPPTAIARAVGLTWRDWRRLVASDPKLSEAVSEALAREEEQLVASLKDGTAKNPAGAIFLLKARHKYRDVPDKEHAAPVVNVAVLLPKAAKDLREYERIIAAPVQELPKPMKAIAAPVEPERADADDWDT
ncbi:MAG: hypothetical protein HXY28_12795 [Hydrogenophilaceae bacterium]|jgi:hypothetical protein|nr:hypothetical protein [Hydrogenophilaceae bacterium]